MNEFLIDPSVPGTTKWITISAGTRAGHSRFVSRGRSHRYTRPMTTNITIPVRETVETAPIESASAHAIQRRCAWHRAR